MCAEANATAHGEWVWTIPPMSGELIIEDGVSACRLKGSVALLQLRLSG